MTLVEGNEAEDKPATTIQSVSSPHKRSEPPSPDAQRRQCTARDPASWRGDFRPRQAGPWNRRFAQSDYEKWTRCVSGSHPGSPSLTQWCRNHFVNSSKGARRVRHRTLRLAPAKESASRSVIFLSPTRHASNITSFSLALARKKTSAKPSDPAQPAFKPRTVKKNDDKYRDRAAERRQGLAHDYAQVEALAEDFERRNKELDKETVCPRWRSPPHTVRLNIHDRLSNNGAT